MGSQITFGDLTFQNIACFVLQVFICFYVNFVSTWFVCCVFILCFEFGFLLIVGESYFYLTMMCQLSCSYVILCVVWIMTSIGINMVGHDNNHKYWQSYKNILKPLFVINNYLRVLRTLDL